MNDLDNDLILRQFEEIEQKVEKLVGVLKSLEARNAELQNKVETLEEELQGKVEVEKRNQEEKSQIREKVDNLLAKLEAIDETS
ncbi:MAG: cell division protein ZapB [Desulfobacteraceae bacterium]|nr:cell division protein ZapB [Desulfobacteraceae bacterium]